MRVDYFCIVLAGLLLGSSVLGSSVAPSARAQTAEDVAGFWVNRNGWVIEAGPCSDGICGRIVAVGGRSSDPQRFDEHNPDPALRNRPLCGITVFGSFVPGDEPGEWEDGWIYNPRDGKTYSSVMSLGENNTLEVRGYILTPALGRTVVLARSEAPPERCVAHETLTRNETATDTETE